MSYQSAASALFVGFEEITANINGIASSCFTIVRGSDTVELARIEDSSSLKSGKSGQANYELTIST